MRVYVAGHRGMVGSAIARKLEAQGIDLLVRSRDELDLLDSSAVRQFLKTEKPDAVIGLRVASPAGTFSSAAAISEIMNSDVIQHASCDYRCVSDTSPVRHAAVRAVS